MAYRKRYGKKFFKRRGKKKGRRKVFKTYRLSRGGIRL